MDIEYRISEFNKDEYSITVEFPQEGVVGKIHLNQGYKNLKDVETTIRQMVNPVEVVEAAKQLPEHDFSFIEEVVGEVRTTKRHKGPPVGAPTPSVTDIGEADADIEDPLFADQVAFIRAVIADELSKSKKKSK